MTDLDHAHLSRPISGYGCTDPTTLPPLPPLAQRVDLAGIAAWTARNEAARAEYYSTPTQFRWGKR